ncbi:MAG: hypothetical protein KGL38_11055 [Gemmatimonadota bacterium]|nr:hypothetical protein [Gemmatimonadota bacterium]
MSRRKKITYLALAIASVVIAACSSPVAPHNDCISGYVGSNGITCN